MANDIRERLEKLLARPKGERLLVEREGIKAIEFSSEHYHSLAPAQDHDVYCIDGGQAIIFETAEILVGVIRVACVKSKSQKTCIIERKQWYVIINTSVKDGQLVYEAHLLGKNAEEFAINPNEAALKDGLSRAKLSKALEVLRKREELLLAQRILEKTNEKSVVALDGELDAKAEIEKKALDNLLEASKKHSKQLVGVVKSTNLVTNKGAALSAFLLSAAPSGRWHYWPLISSEQIDWVIANFAEQQASVYRIDIPVWINQERMKRILENLCSSSQDISLPGYPYGLIVADQFARVSSEELAQIKATVMSELSREAYSSVEGKDTHDMLNRIVHRMNKTY